MRIQFFFSLKVESFYEKIEVFLDFVIHGLKLAIQVDFESFSQPECCYNCYFERSREIL